MKKSIYCSLIGAIAAVLFFTSCNKETTIVPTPLVSTCAIVFNDSINRTADSIHWDYYSITTPRMQAFIGGVAVFTLYPNSINSGTYPLSTQYLYWIIQSPTIYTVNSSGGSLTMTNSANLLSGTFTAMGNIFSGTGPSPTKIRATFSNVKQLGS